MAGAKPEPELEPERDCRRFLEELPPYLRQLAQELRQLHPEWDDQILIAFILDEVLDEEDGPAWGGMGGPW